ncbi:MAG TPA: helix-turn-helix domain-containing protein [Bacteroidales bacterium]|jgi:excisionase family DNA binding protein|nr:helix-turn-helix domain-containing protein [Bacteroidales bacterium]HOT74104.1 helix-turn-helix domain-containing protein [Anaerohalosphaeraceae bacterium]MCI2107896.1 helix-turn-helix domain-containing protein [Bacteroidales bacterium]MCI2133181.1 helix-turn-helix domain-containing protein [Bacteroidales bacterium]HPD48174.1 helix-turn-helix domain-containing protein [Anaerohalosphaeraceae bacterium]
MLQNTFTLEQMPQIVASLEQKVDRLVNLVLELKDAKGNTPDEWMDVEGLMAYHPDKPARKTIYDWVTLRRVPYHKDGKRLRFLRSEIDAWLAGGYHKTEDEMQEAAVDYVNSKRGGLRYDQ